MISWAVGVEQYLKCVKYAIAKPQTWSRLDECYSMHSQALSRDGHFGFREFGQPLKRQESQEHVVSDSIMQVDVDIKYICWFTLRRTRPDRF
jgi:hypothetical protein